jgi:hypothetical protein
LLNIAFGHAHLDAWHLFAGAATRLGAARGVFLAETPLKGTDQLALARELLLVGASFLPAQTVPRATLSNLQAQAFICVALSFHAGAALQSLVRFLAREVKAETANQVCQ